MAKATTTNALTMKLLIDTKSQRVLFAEAGKDVIDFLFSLLTLPVATAVRLVGEKSMVGSVGNLYASVGSLDSTYVQPGADKGTLLCPTIASPAPTTGGSSLRLPEPKPPQPKSLFKCGKYQTGSCYDYVTDVSGSCCPVCKHPMTKVVHYASSPKALESAVAAAKGFVQGIMTYTVMDNLTVSPLSAISSITLLNTFAVTDLGVLQEKVVHLGYAEGLEILKASLQSKTHPVRLFVSIGLSNQPTVFSSHNKPAFSLRTSTNQHQPRTSEQAYCPF